ncbi:MAG: hypothetical protein IKJ18_07970 [Bacteroidaceae bacterium]|nr:hypothetical protein [Bacteroidaceae bacterium]
MKRIIWIAALLLHVGMQLKAQDIPMSVMVIEQSAPVPMIAANNLEVKLCQALSLQGVNGGIEYATFSLVAVPVETSKNIVSGLQPMVTVSLDLALFVGNNITGDKLASTSVKLRGAGTSEEKAYSAAFGSLNYNDADLQSWIKNGTAKVVAYYDREAPNLIRQAKRLGTQHKYEDALALLSAIPACCKHIENVDVAILDVWSGYVNHNGQVYLAQARSVWAANQNEVGANAAALLLSEIYPDASCYPEALSLTKEIQARMGDEWTFSKKMYQDGVDLEAQRIEAARAIGVAYGNNQQPETHNNHWLVR